MIALSINEKIAAVLAERILKDLAEIAAVDSGFINDTRPAITRLFAGLPEERQALFMYILRQALKAHPQESGFDVEALLEVSPLSLKDVDEQSLEKMRHEVHFIHGVVASTVLVSYGGLGEHRLAVEG